MAQIPLVTNRQPIGSREYPIAPPAAFGAGIAREMDRSAEVFQNIQAGYDAAESAMLVGEGSAGLAGVLVDAKTNISDPEEYKAFTQEKIEEVYQGTLDKATSPVVRRRIEAQLADNRARADIHAKYGYAEKQQERAMDDLVVLEKDLLKGASSEDEAVRKQAFDNYGRIVGEFAGNGWIKDKEKRMAAFAETALTTMANNELEVDASGFLLNLSRGKYEGLESTKRMQLMRSANAALASQVTLQERDQKIKREQADRDLQVMFDQEMPPSVIHQKLKDLSAAGILTRTERQFWDTKILKDEKSDNPMQTGNAKALGAEFDGSGYPNMGTVSQYRARADSMLKTNDLGTLGWGEFKGYLNRMEQSLRSEGRAIESAARVRENAAKPDKEKDMNKTDALGLIKQNYPYGSATDPIDPQHKKDVAEFTRRSLVNEEPRGVVAREIYERSQKIKTEQQQKTKAAGEAAAADPKKKSILERLKTLGIK